MLLVEKEEGLEYFLITSLPRPPPPPSSIPFAASACSACLCKFRAVAHLFPYNFIPSSRRHVRDTEKEERRWVGGVCFSIYTSLL